MIPRAKKPKKKSIHRPTKTPYEYVKATNFLNVSAMVRTLATVYDWSKEQIDEFRKRNYLLQNSEDFAFDKLEEFEKEFQKFRENPLVDAFLASELAFCRMMQNIEATITEALHFE